MRGTLHPKSVKCQRSQVFVYTPKGCNNSKMNTGELIKDAREAAGHTQEELAKLLGVAQQTVAKIELGIIKRPRNLHHIESVLGLPSGYLTNAENKTADFPKPLIARCPLLDWQSAANWPQNKKELLEQGKLKSFASQVILGANSYLLRVEEGAMTGGTGFSFPAGSYLVIDPDRKYKSGDFVIAKIKNSEQTFFRRYAKDINTEYLFAFSSAIDPIKLDENITILGVVVVNFNILKE